MSDECVATNPALLLLLLLLLLACVLIWSEYFTASIIAVVNGRPLSRDDN